MRKQQQKISRSKLPFSTILSWIFPPFGASRRKETERRHEILLPILSPSFPWRQQPSSFSAFLLAWGVTTTRQQHNHRGSSFFVLPFWSCCCLLLADRDMGGKTLEGAKCRRSNKRFIICSFLLYPIFRAIIFLHCFGEKQTYEQEDTTLTHELMICAFFTCSTLRQKKRRSTHSNNGVHSFAGCINHFLSARAFISRPYPHLKLYENPPMRHKASTGRRHLFLRWTRVNAHSQCRGLTIASKRARRDARVGHQSWVPSTIIDDATK